MENCSTSLTPQGEMQESKKKQLGVGSGRRDQRGKEKRMGEEKTKERENSKRVSCNHKVGSYLMGFGKAI